MKKLALAVLALYFSAASLKAEIDFDSAKTFSLNAEMEKTTLLMPVPGRQEVRPEKEWTIMVFVNAKNNLESYGLKDMNEMEMIGSGDKYNVVVELARMKGFDSSEGDWTTSRRYLVKKDNDTGKITSPVVEELPSVDMGDYKHLADFINWSKAKYPAKKYMLVVWNHGAGWIKGGKEPSKGISYDDETGHHITTPQLGLALKETGGVDVYGSDACLMQMAEVVYEIKDYAVYIVGSEETEPGDGYTYNDLLAPLFARQDMPPSELAKVAVDAYADHYKAQDEGSTQSYIKSSAITGFMSAANEFSYAVIQAGEKDLAQKAMGEAQSYAYPENKDLYHFAQLVLAGTANAEVKAKAQALMSYITGSLVVHNRTTNGAGAGWWSPPSDYSNSYGIAVYLPGGSAPASYADLQWAKYSNWDDFITWLAQP